MKNNKQEEIWKSIQGMAGTIDTLKKSSANFAFMNPGKAKKSLDDIIEEEQNDKGDEDFTAHQCKICGVEIENLYSWYNLKPEYHGSDSVSVCSIKCLDAFREKYDSDNYEIIEHDRCSAYFECKETGNLRRKCEQISNKSYRDISAISLINYCEPAQAGIILSTHKLTETLKDFSKQTEEQYLSNKEMMEQGARESTKHFRITTWMTILVIILTIINLVPTFLNRGGNNYSEQLTSIESKLSNIKSTDELTEIENKIDEVTRIILNGLKSDDSRIIELLESIQNELKVLSGGQ